MPEMLTSLTMGLSPSSQEHLSAILSGGMVTVHPESLRTTVMITKQEVTIAPEDQNILIPAQVEDARLWYDSGFGGSSWIATLHSPGLETLRRYMEDQGIVPYFPHLYIPFLPLLNNFPPLKTYTRAFLASVNNTLVTSQYVWEFTDLRSELVEYDAVPYREYHEALS